MEQNTQKWIQRASAEEVSASFRAFTYDYVTKHDAERLDEARHEPKMLAREVHQLMKRAFFRAWRMAEAQHDAES